MFCSLLFPEPTSCCREQPDCFRDLNLDLALGPVMARESNVDLSPWFYTPLTSPEQAEYRQEIQKDLLNSGNLDLFDEFSLEICRLSREEDASAADLGDPWRCQELLYGHILDQGERYTACIRRFCGQLGELKSQGLRQGAAALRELRDSPFLQEVGRRQSRLREEFNRSRYCMLIHYQTVRVKKYEGEENLSREIVSVFEKFHQENGKDYRQRLSEKPRADHVEAALLQCLTRIYPELFAALETYARECFRLVDPGVLSFCRELRFYVDWLRAVRELEGLPFCFPAFREQSFRGCGFFDLALAEKIGSRVVKNDFYLDSGEQIFVITGPNQGGKTTYARALGQLHYLASLGLCVPGTSAELRLTDRVLTHFEREEPRKGGRLLDDLQRLRALMDRTSGKSLVIINEIFASTAARDASELGRRMMRTLLNRGCLAVVVTFLSELAEYGPGVVSMMSATDPKEPSVRTFRVIRKPPDGRTYAMTLAAGHGLTYGEIIRRMRDADDAFIPG